MIRVLFFSEMRIIAGHSEILLALKDTPDVVRLWQHLIARYPQLQRLQDRTRVARNLEFVQGNEKFSDGDEIALIPPVSGG